MNVTDRHDAALEQVSAALTAGIASSVQPRR
jgi:hypothetical protein